MSQCISMYFLNYGTWDFPANHVRFQECIPQLSGFFPEMEFVDDFKELHPLEIPEMALSKMRLRIEKKNVFFFVYL